MTRHSHFVRFVAVVAACTIAIPAPAANDPDAGQWQMIVLTGPTQIAVPPPAATNDSSYQAELSAIKSAQSSLTAAQRKAIAYWTTGGVERWNEIALGLVASSDLPPEPNPDGSYPAPDVNNPFANPRYPFANPPYGARAYSYITVSMYEALKAAWYYKYLYNRPAPSKVDSGIQALAPSNDLPAYPSAEGVEAGVALTMMKLLFPTAADEITQKGVFQMRLEVIPFRQIDRWYRVGTAEIDVVTIGRNDRSHIHLRQATDFFAEHFKYFRGGQFASKHGLIGYLSLLDTLGDSIKH